MKEQEQEQMQVNPYEIIGIKEVQIAALSKQNDALRARIEELEGKEKKEKK